MYLIPGQLIMKFLNLLTYLALGQTSFTLTLPNLGRFWSVSHRQKPVQQCANTPKSRACWGEQNIDTDYYSITPETGRIVEVWLSVEEGTCNQDGYERSSCMTFNGTIPGPAIIADWGDNVVVHVTNNMRSNATSVHWHGLWHRNSVEYDGVPGITQCPIPPGKTFTYRFKAYQYGTTWYHSHVNLQIANGLFGPLIFNGPASADYDEDVGAIFLQDWFHRGTFSAWFNNQKWGIPELMTNTLINGTNSYDCSLAQGDPNCVGGGEKFSLVLDSGKKYRMRLINVAADSQFQFSIDGHKLSVIATDLVPIHPYEADSIIINAAQRYDVIVEANALPGDYWLRGDWVSACFGVVNDDTSKMTGIIRYNASSRELPLTNSTVEPAKQCSDEPYESLVPYLPIDVDNIADTTLEILNERLTHKSIFQWTFNSISLMVDWAEPTLNQVLSGVSTFPESYNVIHMDRNTTDDDEWAVLVINNEAGGLFGEMAHPIHIHGHDFWILSQESNAVWDGTSKPFKLKNPPRRDVAILPPHGYLAVAFKLDNPGIWLVHCHIVWHSGQGLALEVIESQDSILVSQESRAVLDDMCIAWAEWSSNAPFPPDGSGI